MRRRRVFYSSTVASNEMVVEREPEGPSAAVGRSASAACQQAKGASTHLEIDRRRTRPQFSGLNLNTRN